MRKLFIHYYKMSNNTLLTIYIKSKILCACILLTKLYCCKRVDYIKTIRLKLKIKSKTLCSEFSESPHILLN